MDAPFPLLGRLSPEDRRAGLVVGGVASAVLMAGVLGVLLAHHLSPCNPRNMGRCGRHLASTLQGLDALDASGPRLGPQEEASALCPTVMEALDCYYWFSQRCLPARDQHFYAKVYVDSSAVVDGLCRAAAPTPAAGPDAPPAQPLLVTHGPCLRSARERRWQCSERFNDRLDAPDSASADASGGGNRYGGGGEGDGGGGEGIRSLIDSLYDPDAVGTFQTPLCRAIREFILCSLHLVNDHCGLHVALRLQDLQDNLTRLVFSDKCEADLRPVLEVAVATLPAAELAPSTPRSVAAVLLLLLLALLLSAILIKRLTRPK